MRFIMKVKSVNALMKYLREGKNIDINGANQKNKLRNIGYYHGYKGYRFFTTPSNNLQYSCFNELTAVYDFDMQLKTVLYPQIMFLETAFKNRVLEIILQDSNSNRFADIYAKLLTDYKSYPVGNKNYKDALTKRLNLRNKIYGVLSRDYKNKLIVKHFYHQDKPVPIWAIFELLSLGEFGTFINCLNLTTRTNISNSIGFNIAFDNDGKLTETIVYTLKDLRNAIAHNDTIFDTRFKTSNINSRLPNYLTQITNVNGITFLTIADYVVLISYLLKIFGVNKTEIRKFIRDFTNCYEILKIKIPTNIFAKIIHTDTRTKLSNLKLFL